MLKFRLIMISTVMCFMEFQIILAKDLVQQTGVTFKIEDIEYWDIDTFTDMSDSEKAAYKASVLKELSVDWRDDDDNEISNPAVGCSCPRIFGPVICDNKGIAHSNICLFLCEKRVNDDLRPKKVLINVDTTVWKDVCK